MVNAAECTVILLLPLATAADAAADDSDDVTAKTRIRIRTLARPRNVVTRNLYGYSLCALIISKSIKTHRNLTIHL